MSADAVGWACRSLRVRLVASSLSSSRLPTLGALAAIMLSLASKGKLCHFTEVLKIVALHGRSE